MDDKSLHIVFEIQNLLIASQYTKSLHSYIFMYLPGTYNNVKEIIKASLQYIAGTYSKGLGRRTTI